MAYVVASPMPIPSGRYSAGRNIAMILGWTSSATAPPPYIGHTAKPMTIPRRSRHNLSYTNVHHLEKKASVALAPCYSAPVYLSEPSGDEASTSAVVNATGVAT
ncbi:uncharacterized protein NECHADRAFT_88493 [Fusarium vanettenii 77-13-4]|uniref:Uncharacterized protein n=1 Tax=Fusarium vanettenii (strain ATCC MYA-4622 / CBS 123669 / FGSC 9596 / NRRL 45880 / 77-13-4) TaxID=660122 RepID=C7ZBQ5_FUSV7|nr:uncharacterized protein NECHADRAFT_88493 [Fusarium vanettenii 77-13-4]EEU38558.1 predicted protein [Fusarium vanettenii 77-13-4]